MALLYIAGAGLIMEGVGAFQSASANQQAASANAQQQREMADYQWEETKNQESYNQYSVDVARINEENIRLYTDQMNLDKYNRELYIRDYNYKSQVEEYNTSEQQYAQQIDYNAMAATIARDESTLWLEEQLQEAAFETENLLLETAIKHQDVDYRSQGLVLETAIKHQDVNFKQQGLSLASRKAQDQFGSTRGDLILKQRSKRTEFAQQAMQTWQQKLQEEGKVRALGQGGRTGRKNRQSILAMSGQLQAMLNSMVTNSDRSFDIEHQKNQQIYADSRRQSALQRNELRAETSNINQMFGFNQGKLEAETSNINQMFGFNQSQIQASSDSAYATNKANLLRIEYENYGADMAADSIRIEPPTHPDDLPEIPVPYYTPRAEIADAYVTGSKPPGPIPAPSGTNSMAMASQIFGSVAPMIGSGLASGYNMATSGGGPFDYGGQTGPLGPKTPPPPVYP